MVEPEDRLDAELRALGRTLVVAAPTEDLAEQVLARLPAGREASRPRDGRWWPARRRLVAVIVALALVALGLTPPVRAAVVEWLRIGGVLVRTGPPVTGPPVTGPPVTGPPVAGPSPTPPPYTGTTVTVAQAQARVDFPVGVPAALGPPDRVSVSTDRRLVGMDWGSGPDRLHLDQFDGQLSWMFLKTTRDPFEVTAVGGRDAVWFATAHSISYVDSDGRERMEGSRVAGPSLVWERIVTGRRVTMRLEGNQSQADAVRAAESVR